MLIIITFIFVLQAASYTVLPPDFFLDINGVSTGLGADHVCLLEKQPGIELGGRVKCFGNSEYDKLKAPDDVRLLLYIFIQIFRRFLFK
jgi:hypothetical protein